MCMNVFMYVYMCYVYVCVEFCVCVCVAVCVHTPTLFYSKSLKNNSAFDSARGV